VKYLRRLLQPRKPAFWLMLVLNALSTALVWIVQHHTLQPVAAIAVVVFAVGNMVLGLYFMRQLLQTQAPEERPPQRPH
jgi:4-hydroxybenzoate polyprenyltransferase